MDVKEMHKNMSNEEIKKRAKNINNYSEFGQKMIIEELENKGLKISKNY